MHRRGADRYRQFSTRVVVAGAIGLRGPRVPALDPALVRAAARRAGFHACGIARAAPLDPGPLDRMLARGAEADMVWLRTQRAERLDPDRLLPGVKSVIALALAYYPPGEPPPTPSGAGEIARYARG